ncbi:hypothetical protein CCUS01_14742 [Colletotrichum cuscutae]|uniref:Uncharacterized protein n=1 Tax=Colletotrichum cuscutae TaxID=1209917 RepID=A0AAI9VI91_9PEZI|nr:hypothetical protein CCUS01_14742 [Colletotrichum cuscutae]
MELTPRPSPTAVRNAGFQVPGSSPSRRVFYRQKSQSARGFLPFLTPVGGLCPRYAAQWVRTNPPNEAPKTRAAMMSATVGHKLSPRLPSSHRLGQKKSTGPIGSVLEPRSGHSEAMLDTEVHPRLSSHR